MASRQHLTSAPLGSEDIIHFRRAVSDGAQAMLVEVRSIVGTGTVSAPC